MNSAAIVNTLSFCFINPPITLHLKQSILINEKERETNPFLAVRQHVAKVCLVLLHHVLVPEPHLLTE